MAMLGCMSSEPRSRQTAMAMLGCMLLLILTCTTVEASDTDFTTRTNATIDSFNTDFNINLTSKDCMQEATNKANEFANRSYEFMAAVTIVNLYTQLDCMDNSGWRFYSRLNSNTTVPPYNNFTRLLNEAIDILSKESGASGITVYRGQPDYFPTNGPYQPNRFTSTTTNFSVALSWQSSNCFVKIKNATGLKVRQFSSEQEQDEVLIKSTAKFLVDMKWTSCLFLKLKSYDPTLKAAQNISHVTSIVEMTHMPDTWNMTALPVKTDPETCNSRGSLHQLYLSMSVTIILAATISELCKRL